MKRILSVLAVLLFTTVAVVAQSPSPGIFNYQGVARNSAGNVLTSKVITLRLTIRDGSPSGASVYQETRTVTTNPFGLFNVQVGSPGASSSSGTIAGVNWGTANKFIQVEIDQNGGATFINIGTAQIASVPYSLYSSLSNDLMLPFNKTQADAGTLFKVTNNGNDAGSTALEGLTNSTASNASAMIGTVTSTSPGSFSAAVRGINNGTGSNGIGVWGSQNGSGWGVYGTSPNGIGVNAFTSTGVGVFGNATTGIAGRFATNSGLALYTTGGVRLQGINEGLNKVLVSDAAGNATWQTLGGGVGIGGNGTLNFLSKWTPNGTTLGNSQVFDDGTNTGIGTTSPTNKLEVVQAAASSSAIAASSTSASAAVPTILASNASTANNAVAVQGTITSTIPGGFSAAVKGLNNSTGATGIGVWGTQSGSGWGVYGESPAGTGVFGTSASGIGGRFTTTSGLALHTTGGVRLAGISEGAGKVLTSDAAGNATWQSLPAGLGGSGTLNMIAKWTPNGTTLGNSQLFDDGTNVGINQPAPAARLDVNGTFKLTDGTQGAGKVLTSDAAGLASWQTIPGGGGSGGWSLTGNAGTNPATNFIGTTDNTNLVLRVNNNITGRLRTDGQLFFGLGAGQSLTSGIRNVSVGNTALADNTTGSDNVAVGDGAMSFSTTASNNTAVGSNSLFGNTTGGNNAAFGTGALINNTTGSQNTAIGSGTLLDNITGRRNTSVGSGSMSSNINGNYNTAIGFMASYSNLTGTNNVAVGDSTLFGNLANDNTAVGSKSLYSNTDGVSNVATGLNALYSNTTGNGNTAVGYTAGSSNDANINCTFIGNDADQASGFDFTNSMALGYGSRINADNQVRIGNTSITSIGGYAAWSNLSDGRFKTNIHSNVPGLNFIMLLKPVTYQFDSRLLNNTLYKGDARYASLSADKALHTGFIAQEVEQAAKSIGYDFSGVDKPKNADDFYSLRYSEFVVPLVKAVQELSRQNDELKKMLLQQQKMIDILAGKEKR